MPLLRLSSEIVAAQNRLETTCAFTVSAVSFASSEDSSVVLIGADSVSYLCRRADFALLCLVLLRDRDMS